MRKKKVGRPRLENVPRGAAGEVTRRYQRMRAKQARMRVTEDIDLNQLALWHRAKLIVQALVDDPRLESPLGRMLLLAHPKGITEPMYLAGERAAQILLTYDRVVLGVNREPTLLKSEGGGRSLANEPSANEVEKAKKNLLRLEGTLRRCARPEAIELLKDLARGADLSKEQADLVTPVLKELVWEFGLDLAESKNQHGTRRIRLWREDYSGGGDGTRRES